jgi:hypothetical protein
MGTSLELELMWDAMITSGGERIAFMRAAAPIHASHGLTEQPRIPAWRPQR